MKTVKIVFAILGLTFAGQLHAQEANNSRKEELKTQILKELRNEKLIYFFEEKVISKEQTNETVYSTRRRFANKEPKENGGIDAIFFSHDTLCFQVNECIIHDNSYTDPKPPKKGKVEAKTIYIPIGLKELSYSHKERFNSDNQVISRDYITLSNIQILYHPSTFGWKPKEIEDRVTRAKALCNLLDAYKKIVEPQLLDKAIGIFQLKVNRYKESGKQATISEEQRKLIVQANAANEDKHYKDALDLYHKVLDIDKFSYPDAYYNMALIFAATNDFLGAIFSIKKYMVVIPPDTETARKIQDKIYEWEYKYNQNSK